LRNHVAHPLDPLTGDEFRAVASILEREHGVGWTLANRSIENTDVVMWPPDMCHPPSTSAHH
jgi:Cu2+-containing amine oxidase